MLLITIDIAIIIIIDCQYKIDTICVAEFLVVFRSLSIEESKITKNYLFFLIFITDFLFDLH